jgi:DEAD/DEAH box helicase domain-containing protein
VRPRVAFFDIESRKWASDLRPDDVEAGWDDLRSGRGGASAIAVYDTRDSWLYLYDDHSAEACARHLEAADVVVGYCSEKFDVPCIEGLVGRRLRLRASFDIYVELTRALARTGFVGQKGDLTLDRIAKRNLGRGKTNHGSNARELAARGRWGELFNYCGGDVHLTHDLFWKAVADGGLIGPKGFVSLPVPEGLQ